jgi:cytochrome c5
MTNEKVTVDENQDESMDNQKVEKYFKIVVAVGVASLVIVGILAFIFLKGTDNQKTPVNVAAIDGLTAFKSTCANCHTAFGIGKGNVDLSDRLRGLPAVTIIKMVALQPQMKDVDKQTLSAITTFLSKNALYGSIEFNENCGKCHKAFGIGTGKLDLTAKVKDMSNSTEVNTHIQARHQEAAIKKNPQLAKINAFLGGSGEPKEN